MKLERLPIRTKMAATCAILTAAGIAILAAGTLFNVYNEQIEAADLELASGGHRVSRMLATGGFPHDHIPPAEAGPWMAFAVIGPDGSLWRSDGSLPGEVARAVIPDARPATVRHALGSWRVKAFPNGGRTVVVSYNLEEARDIFLDLLMAYLAALPLAAFVAGLGGWWVTGRALQPVRALTLAAEKVSAENLSDRVPSPGTRDDIAHLAEVLNAMLARLEKGFRQAERFAADASHELRTPLTIMRGEIEAVLRDEQLPPGAERRLVSLQEETDGLERITGNLLLLARLDAGATPPLTQTVDLCRLVTEACEDAETLAASRDVSLETSVTPGLSIRGDGDLLRRLLLNLLDNATKFNVLGGRVQCVAERHGGGVRLIVRNTGPGIPAGLRPRVFERFFRADPARTRAGHGLGLALAREIARAHGGDLWLSDSPPEGMTEFVAAFPAHPDGC